MSRNNAPLVNYAYLADGTKFKATNADGDGFVYTGSLRWRLGEDELLPESVTITGGRAVCDTTDTWAANYYICDHLGSVRTVTDGNGTVLANYDYLPYGTDMSRDAATADVTDYRFTGKELQRDFGANLYDSFARFQHNNGRFLSIDPKAELLPYLTLYLLRWRPRELGRSGWRDSNSSSSMGCLRGWIGNLRCIYNLSDTN